MSTSSSRPWHRQDDPAATPEMIAALIAWQCQQQPELAQALRDDPRSILNTTFKGRSLPDSLTIEVHDNTDNTWHLPLPQAHQENLTLDEEQLEKIAGGDIVVPLFFAAVIAGVALVSGLTVAAFKEFS